MEWRKRRGEGGGGEEEGEQEREEEGEKNVVTMVLIDKCSLNKGMGRAEKQGQPGQLALKSWGACPTNRAVCFHSFARNICRAGPALPAEPESEWPAKIPAAHCFTCTARYSDRKNTQHFVKTAMEAARSFSPRSPCPRCQGTRQRDPLLNSRRGGGDVADEGNQSAPQGARALPGKGCARHIKSGSHSPQPESAPGCGLTQTQGNLRIKKGLPASWETWPL